MKHGHLPGSAAEDYAGADNDAVVAADNDAVVVAVVAADNSGKKFP